MPNEATAVDIDRGGGGGGGGAAPVADHPADTKTAATKSAPESIPLSDMPDAKPPAMLAKRVPYRALFRFATKKDIFCMAVGTAGAVLNGACLPIFNVIMGDTITMFTDHDRVIALSKIYPGRYPPAVMQALNDAFWNDIVGQIWWILGLAIVTFIVSFLQLGMWQTAGEAQAFRIKQEYFKALLRQEVAYFDDQKRGELTSRITADVEQVQDGIADKVGHTIQYVATFFISFIVAFVKNAYLTGILCCCIPFLIGASGFTGRMTMKAVREALVSYGRAGAIAEEVFTGLRTVISFGAENREADRYEQQLEHVRQQESRRGYVAGIGIGLIFFVLFSSYSVGFFVGSLKIADGSIQIGVLITVFLNYLIGSFSLGNAAPYISSFASAQSSAFSIFQVIDRASLVNPFDEGGLKPETLKGRIEFRDIDFAYPTRLDVPILKKFNLTIEPGMTVALVGQSGSGKSTCVGLLQRFYLPLSGSVLLDGVPIEQLNVHWLRSKIGVVGQEPVLFRGTLRENIAWGALGQVTDDQIWHALRQSNAAAFVSDLPDRLDTVISEGGVSLSGGQKQRIAIARALIRDPKIVLLDEATSALDTQSEAVVQAALDAAAEGRTAIVIAHRLSTVKNADLIVAMRKGVVIEAGTHQQLIEKQGFYWSLVKDQQVSSGQDDEDDDQAADAGEESEIETGAGAPLIRAKSNASHAPSVDPSTVVSKGGREAKAGGELVTIEDEVPDEKSPFLRAMRLNLDQWYWTFPGMLFALCAGAITPIYALVYASAITDFGLNYNHPDKVRELGQTWALVFLGIAFGAGVANYLQILCFTVSGEAAVKKVRSAAFRSLLRQEQGFFDRKENSIGALAGKLAVESALIRKLVGDVLGTLVQVTCSLLVGCGLAIYYGWKLALVTLAGAPIVMLAGMYQSRATKGLNNSEGDRASTSLSSEIVSNVRTVASLCLEKLFIGKYAELLGEHRKKQHRAVLLGSLAFGASGGATMFLYIACFLYACQLIMNEGFMFQDLFKVVTTIMFSASLAGRISQSLPDYSKARHAAIELFRIIDRQSAIDVEKPGTDLPECRGMITFENVHFKYPSRPKVRVHRGLTFAIPAGAKVALVGSSGCGKSTCIQQLERFYDPLRGSITLDGQDITALSLSSLRKHVALVGQEPWLNDTTIREAIRYGAVDLATATDEDVYEAARQADVHEFIMTLPRGYDTAVGEKGRMLSGGQKQRVAIARALMRKPKVLLLDEATSALDAESEVAVQRALDAASKGRTTIAIAHRLSTVANSDIIFVLQHGKVVEQGTHKDLIAKRGFYFKLVEAQMDMH
ncbi:hypothetical protein AMAG_16841 [Allomyces macrogynus ATCC 38327]|uniref:Uncharacterized protein n=1 Tax=Allomyces macrogynus (strain ATCC 38327) TaxID=578462 RepID=A0A0L0TC87_ALLM3|nr:hypothetical protein AMAG_16841 [Allomyces macrogynus ATCC 38327]|eukprot:KNE72357.1 hypothetical protein AMAG_16841 [Allomyces macrogynus ATCC 38327]